VIGEREILWDARDRSPAQHARVAQRLEDELGDEQWSFVDGCPRDVSRDASLLDQSCRSWSLLTAAPSLASDIYRGVVEILG